MEDLTPQHVTQRISRPVSQISSPVSFGNAELQDPPEDNAQLPPEESAPAATGSPQSTSASRLSNEEPLEANSSSTIDTIQFAKFDEMRSKAMAHWTSGVNISLEQKGTAKSKKTGWLSEDDWFSSQPSTNAEKRPLSSPGKREEPPLRSPVIENSSAAPPPVDHEKQAKGSTVISSQPKPYKLTTTAQVGRAAKELAQPKKTQHINTMSSDEFPPLVKTTPAKSCQLNPRLNAQPQSPQTPSSVGFLPPMNPFGQMVLINPVEENRIYQFLYSVERNLFGVNTLQKFRDEAENLLRRANNFSYRTFGALTAALITAIRQEQHMNNSTTSHLLISHPSTFLAGIHPFVQFYVQTAAELMPLLQLLSMLVSILPDAASLIPIPVLVAQLGRIKHTFFPQELQQANALLRSIPVQSTKAQPSVSQNSHSEKLSKPSKGWQKDDSCWGSEIFSPHEDKDSADNEDDDEGILASDLKNPVSGPWHDLNSYLKAHYRILRDEILGPAQLAIQAYLDPQAPTTALDIPAHIYTGLCVYSTMTSQHKVNPIVVLEVSEEASGRNDNLLNAKYGYTAVLAPETNGKGGSDARCQPTSDTHELIAGTVVHATGHKLQNHAFGRVSSCMVAIHLDQTAFGKIDYSMTYTLVVVQSNGQALISALSWLKSRIPFASDISASFVLAPRLLAARNSTDTTSTPVSRNVDNGSDAPVYLSRCELDVSCVMTPENKGCKAQPGHNIWPTLQEKHRNLPTSQRPPLYSLSDSQLNAVQYALCHRVSAISGVAGTGKTFLAKKIIALSYQALVSGHFFHPILVLTRTGSALEDILTELVETIPELILFGSHAPKHAALASRLGERLALQLKNAAARKMYEKIEKQSSETQTTLTRLWRLWGKVIERDPGVLLATMPDTYEEALQHGRTFSATNQQSMLHPEEAWSAWLSVSAPPNEDKRKVRLNAYFRMVRAASNGTASNMPLDCGPISLQEAISWPFSEQQRDEVNAIWAKVPAKRLWSLSNKDRQELMESITSLLLQHIKTEIDKNLSKQWVLSQKMDDSRLQLWSSVCQLSRVIGMTADFAASNEAFISKLMPRIIVVDEASSILESLLVSLALGPRMEHLVMLGESSRDARPEVINKSLRGDPYNLDVSLFERWKLSGGEVMELEEQWRMCSDVADLQVSLDHSSNTNTLQTRPMISMNTNYADKTAPPLLGLTYRTFFVDYQTSHSDNTIDPELSQISGTTVTEKQTDEARFVCSLALYFHQQGYKPGTVTILTLCLVQLTLIKAIMKEEMSSWSCFVPGARSITIDLASNWIGKESQIVVLSIGSPSGPASVDRYRELALSRAQHGLYIIGSTASLLVSRWSHVASYMSRAGRCSTRIPLKCQNHKDNVTSVGFWRDFAKVKNGGCSQSCNTLLECGHVCPEACHHLSHSQVVCTKSCQRSRPNGCTHPCPKKCCECASNNGSCPPCREQRVIQLPCGHTHLRLCSDGRDPASITCTEMTIISKPCGHSSTLPCGTARLSEGPEPRCKEQISHTLDCGHAVDTMCGYAHSCIANCETKLDCGHQCPSKCGTSHSHDRVQCMEACRKQLICGHNCSKGCNRPNDHTDRCLENCRYVCSHGYKCGRECWKACNQCNNPCPSSCIHGTCTKKCHEVCDRLPCDMNCPQKLTCSHPCAGLCGEACPPCKTCHPDLQCTISLRSLGEFDTDENIYILPECGCVFSVEALDLYFRNQAKNGEHTAIKLWQCPSCQVPIYTALRYSSFIKTQIALVNEIKAQQEVARQTISEREKSEIIHAMNTETRASIHNIVGGRWFVCENQHPYYIGDCGGATEVSTCPQCGMVIGGLQHKVVESNRFYGQFDNSPQPAWPGQPESST